jgi:acyl-CoA synthetase (AMP-forming)/AMP-acid ligase II/acetyltransferase-like isoleucine patch superfamily enzyme/acyl carrier protein
MSRRFLDRIAAALHGDPARVFTHYYRTATGAEAVTFGALRTQLVERVATIRSQTRASDLVFIICDDPLRQIVWWLASLFAGVTPGILTPLTPKLDQAKYFSDLKALTEHYPTAHLLLDDIAASAEYSATVPAERCLRLAPSGAAELTIPDHGGPLIFQQSSGTTGLRKGVLLSEQVVVRQLDAYARAIALAPDDVIVSWLPLYHDMGLVGCLMQAVYQGTPLVQTSPFVWLQKPEWLFAAIRDHRGTLCWLPNFAFNLLGDRVSPAAFGAGALATLRAVVSCSEPVVAASLECFRDSFAPIGLRAEALSGSYALAENTFAATQSVPGAGVKIERINRAKLEVEHVAVLDAEGISVASSGKAISNTRIRLRQGERLCGDGEVGDIELTSDCMFDGYFGVGAGKPVFTADGWYCTGDYGYQRDGELFVLGRRNDLIIRAGRNLHPADIERVLDGEPEIKAGRVAAFGVFNESEGTEDVVVLAEFGGPRVSDLDAIARAAQDRLSSELGVAAQRVEIVRPNWLVKSSSGKISRAGCRAKFLEMLQRRAAPRVFLSDYADTIDDAAKDSFRTFGAESKLRTPTQIHAPGRISIGNWVSIGRHAKILMQTDFSGSRAMIEQHYPHVAHDFDPRIFGPRDPVLKIGDGTFIGDFVFISCALSIEIGKHVVFSDRVFLSDSNHCYENADLPILLQANTIGRPIVIEDHAWIGINAVILEGVTVGRHSIVSASAVVTSDVPPFSVVAGNPARVVRFICGKGGDAAPATDEQTTDTDAAARLLRWFAHECRRTVAMDESILRSGLMDSLASLRLLAWVEAEFGISLSVADLLAQKIDSVRGLASLLTREEKA